MLLRLMRVHDLEPDPIVQFQSWYDEVCRSEQAMPDAMTLATTGEDGAPAARIVLLKSVDEGGFVFFTNYQSRKAHELERNRRAALVFYWPTWGRQVRIEGTVGRVSEDESRQYFASRPRGSKLAAWASPQSQVLPDRARLDALRQDVAARFTGDEVPCPPFWGGYRVRPQAIEFWLTQSDRLHDRVVYTRVGTGPWTQARLAP